MRKTIPALLLVLCCAGCQSFMVRQADDPDSWRNVGEEIPPACVLGKTYDKAEQLKPTTRAGQVMTGLQWLWSIGSEIAK